VLGYIACMPMPIRCRCLPLLALLLLGASAPVHAATLDLRVGIASEEVFRGVVQNNSPTASLRADYRFASRAYLGSRLLNNRSAGAAQVDVYAGYARALQLFDLIPVGVDGGINVSVYSGDRRGPPQRDLDWAEAYAAIDSGPARVAVAFAPDYFGTGAPGWRAACQLRWPLRAGLDATAALGWNDGSGLRRHLVRRGGDGGYGDYSLLLSQALPAGITGYGQITGASTRIDGSARPRLLVGLRWRWGAQLP